MSQDTRARLAPLFRGPRGRLLAAFLLTEFAAGVGGLSYSAVLPVAAHELGGTALYGPAVTASGVVSIAFMAVGAYLYGRLGPQVQLWTSTVVFLLGVAVTVTAPSMGWVVAGLALRGVAAGLMAGLGMGVLAQLYPDARERERAFGLYALMWLVPSLVAPLVNSALLLSLGWRTTMAWPALLLLVGRLLISRALTVVDVQRPETPAKVRGPGAFLAVAVGLAVVQVALGAQAQLGVTASVVVAVVVSGMVLMLPFRRALRLTVPGQRRAQSGGWVLALVCGSYFSLNALLPLLAVTYLDRGGVLAAVLVAVSSLLWAVVSSTGLGERLSARAAHRLAALTFSGCGALLVVFAVALTGDVVVGGALLCVVSALSGVAVGASYPKVMAQTLEGFEEREGTTTTHGGVVLELGEDVGTAVGVSVVAGVAALAVGAGNAAVAVLAAVFTAVSVAAWMLTGRSRVWAPAVPAAAAGTAS
ncbi:Major Facilitator Superfamily protein [Quadrisphaera granulorum]|uniref:MFS transporter n=1 Tax=Quadrisphaera granulorum TaxID=317664 RepID=A0A316ACT9_9ACTN|nr:MFS transporter [Quadrisphaera granulorum]PWJ47587.1 MFS transporter [Quadrisphaera granulorum]SZE98717.1 Major Facilitator Superfamily protein [Quadrisphaera granulorum]